MTRGDRVVKREEDKGLDPVVEPRRETWHSLVQADTVDVQ